MDLKTELEQRGFLHQYTHEEVFALFDEGGKKFYLGVDLSADSMTIGNFVPLMMAIRIMLKWNTAYLLVWGATSTIWNPSGKDTERPILTDEQLLHNQECIGAQFWQICKNIETISGKKLQYKIVNNKDFFTNMNVLDYLKEVGRHITVNRMLGKDIVRKRVTDPDKHISYAEFSYMLIMWYDFYHLYKHDDVIMEIGGSDERDGIITGIELIGKKLWKTAYGITNKLIVDSSGKKFGKSEGNALWLDPEKNSPYVIYQYFINTADEDIERYLKLLTLLSFEEITKIMTEHEPDKSQRLGQQQLAYYVVQTIFGQQAADYAKHSTQLLFQSEDIVAAIAGLEDKEQIQFISHATWWTRIDTGTNLSQLAIESGLANSNGELKKLIKQNGLSLNGNKIHDLAVLTNDITKDLLLKNQTLLLQKGKTKVLYYI